MVVVSVSGVSAVRYGSYECMCDIIYMAHMAYKPWETYDTHGIHMGHTYDAPRNLALTIQNSRKAPMQSLHSWPPQSGSGSSAICQAGMGNGVHR